MTLYIGFTGHRDRVARESDLDKIREAYPDATWVHGGAIGFDSQVERYAERYAIRTVVINPDYSKYSGNVAPLVRDEQIVDMVEEVYACYDGRKKGGTYYTITYAGKVGKKVTVLGAVKP